MYIIYTYICIKAPRHSTWGRPRAVVFFAPRQWVSYHIIMLFICMCIYIYIYCLNYKCVYNY